MLHAAEAVAVADWCIGRILEEGQQLPTHVEEIVAEVVIGRLAAVGRLRHAPHVHERHAERLRVEGNGPLHVGSD
jgi:hypothetical protein